MGGGGTIPIVIAKKISRKIDSFFYKIFANFFYYLFNKISETKIINGTGDFRLFDRKVCDSIKNLSEVNRYMSGLYSWVGYNFTLVEYEALNRNKGISSFNLSKLIALSFKAIFNFSTLPIKIFLYMGTFACFLIIFYIFFILIKFLIYGIEVPGYISIISFVSLLSSLQLVGIGILGEYIGRIFLETKKRPLYVINKIII
jgi:polyisoprenyl-phosphate glycosyltransferase